MMLRAVEAGQGAPVVLLHGLFGRAQNLGGVARHLAALGRRVISLDLRNHGASPHADGMRYADLAADVVETVGAMDALPAAVLGHSMGGKVAMAMALVEGGSVDRILVADIAPIAYRHGNARIARAMMDLPLRPGMTRGDAGDALRQAVPDDGVRAFLLQNFVPGAAPAWRIGLREIADGLADIEGWPDWPEQVRFNGPALFVTGALSDYVPESARGAILERFPRARIVRLEGAGHWLHADRPEPFAAIAAGFLAADGDGRKEIPDLAS
jgi:pimeloyl-ACP methyl ester carboxylesterase